MLLGVDAEVWKILLVVLVCLVLAVGLLNVLLRNRGGVSPGWGAALVLLLAGVMAVLLIFEMVRV